MYNILLFFLNSVFNFQGIKVYGVQVFNFEGVDEFYRSLATETNGHYLKLTEFSNICDLMMAICYAERGEDFLMVGLLVRNPTACI